VEKTGSKTFVAAFRPFHEILILVFCVLIASIVAYIDSPSFLRPLSMQLRTGFGVVIPSTCLVLYLAFRLKGWPASFVPLLLTLSVFSLALSGVWASGQTESGLLSGVIPMFDSATYYGDSLRLLAGQEFSDGSTRRPVFSAFFAFLLRLTDHNLLAALTVLTLLVALACYLLAKEIRRTHGPAVAAFVLVFVFIYYRYHSGVVRTENLGILFGALGTALIWRGILSSHRLFVLAGIALTSLGMIARAGAFFILPLLILWAAFLFRKENQLVSWQFLAAGMAVVALAFVLNQVMVESFGAKNIVPFGNFSYSLYGLASGGKSWAFVHELYPGADDLEIYRLAVQLILDKPELFIKGVFYNYSLFFSNTNYGVFSYMRGEGKLVSSVSYWGLLLLSSLGLWSGFQRRQDPYSGFVMASTAGLLLSVPFLPPTDAFRLRVYATSIVILALLPSMGLQWVLAKLKLDAPNRKDVVLENANLLAGFSILVVVIAIAGPFLAWRTDPIPSLDRSNCTGDLVSLVVRYDPGSMLHFVSQTTPLLDRAPNFHIGTFRHNLHGFPNFSFMDWALENVTFRHTLFPTLDYRTYRNVLVVTDSDALPSPPVMLELCGHWEENPDIVRFGIFTPVSLFSIDQN
jgi:hypothetical protein